MTGDRQMFPVQTTSTRTRRAWQSPRTRRASLTFVLLSVVAVLGGSTWLAVGAWTVLTSTRDAQTQVVLARAAYGSRDLTAGAFHIAAVQDHLDTARRASSGPEWAVAGTLPVVGDDIRAVAAVVSSAAGLVDALAPVAAVAGTVGTDTSVRSVLLQESLPTQLTLAHDRSVTASRVSTELAGWNLHPAVQQQVESFGALVAQVVEPLAAAESYGELLPRLLGAQTPQDLLVVIQTPAEVRSLGGLAGLVLVVRADAGELTVVESYSGSTVPASVEPVLDTPELREHYALLGNQMGRLMVNASGVPDPMLASELLAEWHRLHSGTAPDAVVLMDMTLLSGLLAATGPVTLPDGQQLTADSSDDLLQHGVYEQIESPSAQDAYFAGAATALFGRLTDPATAPVAIARAFAAGAADGRLTLWSPDAATQALLGDVGLDGDLLTDPAAVGVFLNDATGAKMQYFLDSTVTTGRRTDGRSTVLVELASSATDPATLPDYVAGGFQRLGLPRGTQRVQVAVYAPEGDGLAAWRVDGVGVGYGSVQVGGRSAGVHNVDIAPGQRVRLEVDLFAEPPEGPYLLATTPSLRHEPG